VLQRGDVFVNPRSGAQLEILRVPKIAGEAADAVLEVRRVLRPGMGFPVTHVHLDLEETFRVEHGIADATVGRRRLRLGPEDELVVARDTPHMNPCNRSREDVVLVQAFGPGTESACRFVEALADLLGRGRDFRGDLPPEAAMALFGATDAQTFARVLPRGLQRHVVFPLAAPVARWRGTYPPAGLPG
jgi:mannose-6-phosphate isomerase-like protein (cupin superfamily)